MKGVTGVFFILGHAGVLQRRELQTPPSPQGKQIKFMPVKL